MLLYNVEGIVSKLKDYELCVIYILLRFCMLVGNFRRFVYLHAFPVFHKLGVTQRKNFPITEEEVEGLSYL